MTINSIEKIANLAKISISKEEEHSLSVDFNSILTWVDQLKSIHVDDSPYTSTESTPERNDIPIRLDTQDIIECGPDTSFNMFKVAKVIDGS